MANLKEIRTRITSVSSTRQITSAMKMVAAAKLKKAQDAILQLRPYADKMKEIITTIGDAVKEDDEIPYVAKRDIQKVLLVVVTSNKGLCGAFNSSVIKRTIDTANTTYQMQAKKGNVDLFIIGKKAADIFRKMPFRIIENRSDILDNLNYDQVSELSQSIIDSFLEQKYDRIDIIYNEFRNAAVQILKVEQFLPIKIETPKDEKDYMYDTFIDYIFEPSKEYIIKEMIPRFLRLQFYKALLDSYASEHGARMTAMYKATDNATELIRELKLDYNKARQALITNEIIEIVSGATALEE